MRSNRWIPRPLSVVALIGVCAIVALAQGIAGDVDGDGDVDRNDLTLIAAGLNQPAGGPNDPRDIDKDGRITIFDVRRATSLCTRPGCAVETFSLSADSAPKTLTLLVGETVNFTTTVGYTASDTVTRTTTVTQGVTPSEGIEITPPISSGFTQNATFSQLDNQTITATVPGTYTITTTASAAGTTSTTTVTVNVVSSLSGLIINLLGTEPSALPPNANVPVVFTAQINGVDSDPPAVLLVEGVGNPTTGNLTDSGSGGDLVAGDLTYSGTVNVSTSGMQPGSCLTFRVRFSATTSGNSTLCVTSLPVGFVSSNTANPFQDPVNGPVVRDEALVEFNAGVSESSMIQVAAAVGGTIVGFDQDSRTAQIRFTPAPATLAALNSLLSTLAARPEVLSVSPNALGGVTAVTPNDPQFASQASLTRIRADEAWTIARGGALIAVVDSGVDYNHPDLSGKVILGKDFVNNDNDPSDDNGHGTHVAGIAAANSNNGTGISGVAWNSKILAIKSIDSGNVITAANAVSGIKYAADKGARIINASFEFAGGQTLLCNAVSYANGKGSIVVAAAGNKGSSVVAYPAACGSAIAVGNTTATDGRASSSNFGTWVDLAAPGSGIVSTVPTGSCQWCAASGYRSLTGTSQAAPHVAGAIAVLLSRQPSLTNAQVEERLKLTAKELPGLQLGAGRIDLMEAVFNGSFEEPNLALWTKVGTASSIETLGPIQAQHPTAPTNATRKPRMAFISTGPAGDQVSGTLTQTFTIQPGVTSFPIRFTYAFVSEEFPEWVGTEFNDSLKITLRTPAGQDITLAEETVNGAAFVPITGIDFPGGDETVGWTQWKTVSITVPVTAGPGRYQIFLTDAGDDIYDTVTLIDKIEFK